MSRILILSLLAAALLAPLAQAGNAARLQRLEDERDVQALLNDYGRAMDEHDWTKMMTLFTKDGVWGGRYGSAKGPEAIKALMDRNVTIGAGAYHLFSNVMIDVHAGTATLWSHWAILGNKENTLSLLNSGHYDVRAVRESGHWKFANFTVQNDLPHIDNPASPK